MKIKKSLLMQMIREEIMAHVGSMLEADIEDAEQSKKGKEGDEPQKDPDNSADKKKSAGGPKKEPAPDDGSDEAPPEQDIPDEPDVDQDLEQDATDDASDEEEDGFASDISDSITGKSVQSITMEPESKVMPGAQEIVLTFNEMPDPLRILLTKTGKIAFYFRGLHNEL